MGIFEKIVSQSGRRQGRMPLASDRRQSIRLPQRGVSLSNMMSHQWELELLPAIALTRLEKDIIDLSQRSLEPNIFFETEVLLAAWPRLTSVLAAHGSWMLCLWENTGNERALRLFMPVRLNKIGLPRKTVLQPLSNEYAPVGTPLIDADCVDETAETFLRLMGDPKLGAPVLLHMTHQRQSGGTYKALLNAARNLGLPTEVSASHQRAALHAKPDPDSFMDGLFSKKRKRELGRQFRRLNEQGEVWIESARSPEDVLDAFERFITLELQGWKGRRGTALYSHKKIAAFSRQIVVELTMNNGCEIFSLKQRNGEDETTIGSLIMLGRNGHLVPWKMAFKEDLKAYSPGMQTMVKATEILIHRKDFISADSLAIPDHWMMNSVWPDRIKIAEVLIGLHLDSKAQLKSCQQALTRYTRLKDTAKSGLRHISRLQRKLRAR